MAELTYTTRGVRQRGQKDSWEITFSHKDPITGKAVRTYHTVEAKTRRQALRKRDELVLELERKGGALATGMTVREFMDRFLDYKEKSGTIEPSTVQGYRGESKLITRYLGAEKLASVAIGTVNDWMAAMTGHGYTPKTCAKAFRLFKQALKWAVAQDLITPPCDFCKPSKHVKTPINALNREDRTRMMRLAVAAQPSPLGIAIELALTTGMRRGEVCALRWSDLGDDGTVTASHALGNAEGDFCLKESKTQSSRRTIPLTRHTWQALRDMRAESIRKMATFGLSGDPFVLGTQEPDSRPYNPTQIGKDFAAFCKMNGFRCTFHDLRHTFATMMITAGTDVRSATSHLGHTSVSMTLSIYANVDPDAKKAAVSKVNDCFDVDMTATSPIECDLFGNEPAPQPQDLTFTVDQLEAMLAQARAQQAGAA